MTTKIVDLEQQPGTLDDLLAQLHSGTEILLVRGDAPVARLTPAAPLHITERTPGLHAGTTWVSDDFDAPLPDEFWLGEA